MAAVSAWPSCRGGQIPERVSYFVKGILTHRCRPRVDSLLSRQMPPGPPTPKGDIHYTRSHIQGQSRGQNVVQMLITIMMRQLTNKRTHGKEAQRPEEVPGAVDGCEARKTHHFRHQQVVEAPEHSRGAPPDAHHPRLPRLLCLLGEH